jgi:amidophosphoribosyltransferase
MLLNILADELLKIKSHPLTVDQIFEAVTRLYGRCRGGYAVVALINGHGILAFRDPHGIRPLVFGSRKAHHGMDFAIASESVAIDTLELQLQRDVAPGEAIFIQPGGLFHACVCAPDAQLSPCIFEHVYFARPDSVMDGISVYQARRNMGSKLAERIMSAKPSHEIDVVIPIPDTSRTSALEASHRLNVCVLFKTKRDHEADARHEMCERGR